MCRFNTFTCYLKYIVIDLNDSNEPFVPSVNTLEGQGMNTLFRNFVGDQGIKFCSKIQSAQNRFFKRREREISENRR
jgi:hypothetical protein